MKKTLQVLNEMKDAGIISHYAIGGAVGAFFYTEAILTYDWIFLFYCLPEPGAYFHFLPSTIT